jgi:oligoribonuclease NrnB/cAMP/cGMP phosphodiesterase (DHH superfamily)
MKTICIYHSRDLDGWMSGAIVRKWFEEKYKDNNYHIKPYGGLEVVGDVPELIMLGWDYGDEIPDLSEYDKVIMCDIAFPKEVMKLIAESTKDNFIWIDHHSSAINELEYLNYYSYKINNNTATLPGYRDTQFAACELTWKYFFPGKDMPELVRLLGRYDCFGHKGTDEERKILEFQYGARQVITNYDEAYKELDLSLRESDPIPPCMYRWQEILLDGKVIYKYVSSEAKQIYKRSFPMTFIENTLTITTDGSVGLGSPSPTAKLNIKDFKDHGDGITSYTEVEDTSKRYTFLAVNQERFNPINFGIDYHEDGYDGFACFWYKDGKWMWSLYNDNGEVDCSIIAKQYGGGGHKGAAGFVVDEITCTIIWNRFS